MLQIGNAARSQTSGPTHRQLRGDLGGDEARNELQHVEPGQLSRASSAVRPGARKCQNHQRADTFVEDPSGGKNGETVRPGDLDCRKQQLGGPTGVGRRPPEGIKLGACPTCKVPEGWTDAVQWKRMGYPRRLEQIRLPVGGNLDHCGQEICSRIPAVWEALVAIMVCDERCRSVRGQGAFWPTRNPIDSSTE